MADSKHTVGDLRQLQSLPLRLKILLTRQRIAGYAERDRQREKALAVSPFGSSRFLRYAHLKEREV